MSNTSKIQNISLGKNGEDAVAKHLEKNGFFIVAKNYRKNLGEIDIIASKKQTICFVEVKTRKKQYFPMAEIIVTKKKKHIIDTAKTYLYENNISDKVIRFDVALVRPHDNQYDIEYISDAFSSDQYY